MPDIEGFDFIALNVNKTLESLRWKEDMVVVNDFGETVWLKPLIVDGRRIGITDCCFASYPCLRHAAQHSVQLTALRRGLVVSIFINVILLAVALFTIGGN